MSYYGWIINSDSMFYIKSIMVKMNIMKGGVIANAHLTLLKDQINFGKTTLGKKVELFLEKILKK